MSQTLNLGLIGTELLSDTTYITQLFKVELRETRSRESVVHILESKTKVAGKSTIGAENGNRLSQIGESTNVNVINSENAGCRSSFFDYKSGS